MGIQEKAEATCSGTRALGKEMVVRSSQIHNKTWTSSGRNLLKKLV